MRQAYLIIIALAGLMASSCLKTSPLVHSSADAAFKSAARGYFRDSVEGVPGIPGDYKSGITRTVNWEEAIYMKLSSTVEGILVPVQYHDPLFVQASFGGYNLVHLDDLTKLLIYKRQGEPFHAELLTAIPDTGYLRDPSASFMGYVFAQNWWGNELGRYLYAKNEVLKYEPPTVQANSLIRSCNVIYGYNYGVNDPAGGYSWTQTGGCSYMYLPDRVDDVHGGLSGGLGMTGGGGFGGGASRIALAPPDNPIANIAEYFRCFTNVGGSDHRYAVTICVDQPVPNTRTPWTPVPGGPIGSSNAGNVVDVGHTFLVFTETYGGTTVTRNVGFYPTSMVTPANKTSQGKLNNDEGHEYNISATFTVTNAQFFTMLDFAGRGNTPGFLYNLNTENCSSYALQTLVQGGINLPSTMGTWINGMGNNPGDLGEDIRQMTPLANMTKSTVENYHPNVGNCN